MNMKAMIDQQDDWHIQFLGRRLQWLQEMREGGKRDVEISIDQMEMLIGECVGLHQHVKRLEKMLTVGYEAASWNLKVPTQMIRPEEVKK